MFLVLLHIDTHLATQVTARQRIWDYEETEEKKVNVDYVHGVEWRNVADDSTSKDVVDVWICVQ